MKIRYLLLFPLMVAACEQSGKPEEADHSADTPTVIIDSLNRPSLPVHHNDAFRASVEKVRSGVYVVKGQARVFEAAYSWVVEDGHNELQSGHGMTSAGAPEWGDFQFTVHAEKADSNSTLHIILYEASAKNGSRLHQLPILLY